jgi:hypothetical protein
MMEILSESDVDPLYCQLLNGDLISSLCEGKGDRVRFSMKSKLGYDTTWHRTHPMIVSPWGCMTSQYRIVLKHLIQIDSLGPYWNPTNSIMGPYFSEVQVLLTPWLSSWPLEEIWR